MTVELGHYALIVAFFAALTQAVLPMIGAARGQGVLMGFARPAAETQLLAIALAYAALTHAYVSSDFSVRVVAENSHTLKPLLYKITGVWANHEGSMLLWVLVLALFGALVAWFGGGLPERLKARVLAVQGIVALGFLAFMLLTSNPFARLAPAPIEGHGLNPILQDPGLAFHPPMLYLGYVGTSVTFAFAVAALIEGRIDAAWARWVRPWALASWSFLTLGIALGSWWAYYELGWGGWWFWDPVENASLMPWLVTTALLHSAIVTERRGALKRWSVLLAIAAFALSLIGTFLVRSGVLSSVHAFAVDPARGLFILMLLVVIVGGALWLYATRIGALEPGGDFSPISREGALVVNNLLLAAAAATVFLGTLYPLFLDAVGGGTVTVGPPYFDRTVLPMMAALVVVMAVGPLMPWKRADLPAALAKLKLAALGTVAVALLVVALLRPGPILAAPAFGLAAWLVLGTLTDTVDIARRGEAGIWHRLRHMPRGHWGKALGHLGLAVTIIGMSGSLLRAEDIRVARPGEVISIGPYQVRYQGTVSAPGPNYAADRARLDVLRDGDLVAVMHPEKRRFIAPPMQTTEVAIHTTGTADLYAALGDADGTGGRTLRLYHEPLVPLIWWGAVLMALGGAASLADGRLRGAARARAAAIAVPAE